MTEMMGISLSRGECPVHVFEPAAGSGAAPTVLLFMDGFGPRATLFSIAQRLADEKYRVLLPDLFYGHLPYPPLDPASVFTGGEDLTRLMTMLGELDQAAVTDDINGLLEASVERWGPGPVGAVGYCMGGRFALTAATLSDSVVAAASLHGSNLASAEGDSPHLHFSGVKASIYVGVAADDPTFGAEEEGRLAAALRAAQINHTIEIYAGTFHGFVMEDLPIHDRQAAEHHWQRVSSQFREAFSGYVHGKAGNSEGDYSVD